MKKSVLILIAVGLTFSKINAENGYDLWLRYQLIDDSALRSQYAQYFSRVLLLGKSETIRVIDKELNIALPRLLGTPIAVSSAYNTNGKNANTRNEKQSLSRVIIASRADLTGFDELANSINHSLYGDQGFAIEQVNYQGTEVLLVTAKTHIGLLYGTFHFLNGIQQHKRLNELSTHTTPLIRNRVLNHWDNLDRTVERGYAAFSIWDWQKLPDYIDPRYIDYARACASIGINGTVLTNVNANSWVLTPMFLEKVAALANTFRPYGIRVFLTARFNAPMELGGLQTADPLDKGVVDWWKAKVDEIYRLIPDFGGFLVKANSEGQPGPQSYGRSHAQGANMLASALAPHNGIVMWRAFVYEATQEDRAKQAYIEFKPLDGKFEPNVMVQVKNGAIDFQPREPFHPLFGAMPRTPLMMEFQITQEYTGCATHLFYEAPLFKETLDSDTYSIGKGSTVARIIDGSLEGHSLTGIAGVANVGTDINWCGHPFAQANWYAFGRLAWDHTLTAEQIAEEWLRMTFTANPEFVSKATRMMLESRENLVNYMTPLGLHHIMAKNHHYGPGPWVSDGRPDWTSVYYHRADEQGIGFNRSTHGSDAVSQYSGEVKSRFNNPETCPLEYLLWFHHVSWDQVLPTGRTLWNELCYRYQSGVEATTKMRRTWDSLRPYVDAERFEQVATFLGIQNREAAWWRDACLLYFQLFSRKPFPIGVENPKKKLQDYMSIQHKYVPGIKNE
jgi:alpha-glucuronidase